MRITSTSKHHPVHHRRRKLKLPLGAQRFLAVFEGIEGGFAISASIIAGLYFANLSHDVLIATILTSILVNGFNTASVKYSSEHYLDKLDGREKRSKFKNYFIPSLIEFITYISISIMAIVPLLVIQDTGLAIIVLAITNVIILFLAGLWRGYILQLKPWSDAIETCMLGAAIIMAGALSGWVLHVVIIS